jgi:hypothetical protein
MTFLQDAAGAPADWTQARLIAETFKNWVEAFAWACAGGFFIYKAFSGYLISNLSLALTCQRQHASLDADYLVVTANLKKGDRGAVTLHDITARVSPTLAGEQNPKALAGIRRLTSKKVGPNKIFQIENSISHSTPLLNLPPGEETAFSACFKVPGAEPCTVEVTVLGGWVWHRNTRYQWRASTISLPIESEKAKPPGTQTLSDASLKEFLIGFLDIAAKKLAETDEPQTAHSLAALAVELFTKQLASPDIKAELTRRLEPLVQDWLEDKP